MTANMGSPAQESKMHLKLNNGLTKEGTTRIRNAKMEKQGYLTVVIFGNSIMKPMNSIAANVAVAAPK